MNIKKCFDREVFDKEIKPEDGIGTEAFGLISCMTPIVNVDLLIRNEEGKVLVSWRDDEICGRGWHLIGGIVRFKETFEERIHRTALEEIGTDVEIKPGFCKVSEVILPQENRGHFISFLFECELKEKPDIPESKEEYLSGELHWYEPGTDGPLVKGQRDIYSELLEANNHEEN